MTRERTASENEKFRIEGIKKLAKKMEKERNYMKIDELIEDLHLAESRVRHCLEKYQFDLGISNSTIGDFQKDTKYIIRLLNEIKEVTIKDILPIHIVNEGLSYDPDKWCQYAIDNEDIRVSININNIESSITYYYVIRPFRNKLPTLEEFDNLEKRYLSYYISLQNFIKIYCDAYELDYENDGSKMLNIIKNQGG